MRSVRRGLHARLWLLGTALALGACQVPSGSRGGAVDGPPPAGSVSLAALAALPNPVPRSEPRSARGNPAQYQVFGRTYRLLPSASGYDAQGNASWYGRKFHGRTTSSGEPFDMYRLTAAHRSLPIPSYAKVTNLGNGRTTVVRINDRGPFHDDRILDLSYAAAVKLGFHDAGTARVRVQVVAAPDSPSQTVADRVASPAPALASAALPAAAFHVPKPRYERPETVASAARAAAGSGPVPNASAAFFLQAGAFRARPSAESLRSRLSQLLQATTEVAGPAADQLYRVRVGPFSTEAQARAAQSSLKQQGFASVLISPSRANGSCVPQC